jgi:hypothetical protein
MVGKPKGNTDPVFEPEAVLELLFELKSEWLPEPGPGLESGLGGTTAPKRMYCIILVRWGWMCARVKAMSCCAAIPIATRECIKAHSAAILAVKAGVGNHDQDIRAAITLVMRAH